MTTSLTYFDLSMRKMFNLYGHVTSTFNLA